MYEHRIIELRFAARLTLTQLAAHLHITCSDLRAYESDISTAPTDTLIQLCNLFQVTPNYLLGYSDAPEESDATEKELLTLYKALDDATKGILLERALMLWESQELIYIVGHWNRRRYVRKVM